MNDNDNKTMLIQSLFLASGKALSIGEIAKAVGIDKEEVEQLIVQLVERFNQPDSGWWIIRNGNKVQLATNPAASEFLTDYLQVETKGELTRPALETLTIIAYQGPITKDELNRIRGVNCSLILRNLMIRGLVEEVKAEQEVKYQVTMDFVKFLGLGDIRELPDYDKMHQHEFLQKLMQENNDSQEEPTDNFKS